MEYNFTDIEKKWQHFWATNKTFKAEDSSIKPKYYVLDMFPYPSGAGLHVGHPLGYIASDIIARYKRHKGFNVLHPMGYDSFGLPAEQYAIQTGQHPKITTEENIARYRQQMDKIGFSFDWDREVRTSDPEYYKWTQWIFIQIFNSWYNKTSDKAENISSLIKEFEINGNTKINAVCDENVKSFTAENWKSFSEKEQSDILMAYRLTYLGEAYVNWCPALGTVLANDEVKDGVSERGGHPVERKLMKQWSMRISAYAQRLLDGLDTLDWTESLKESQRYWIGRSEGTSLRFKIQDAGLKTNDIQLATKEIEVFTTRPDTIFGVAFVTLAPEHELVSVLTTAENKKAVDDYVTVSKNRSERERQADVTKISGVFTGSYVLHPFTGKQIPIWVGDYVLAGYGTGAVMAVPAHDERDFKFANYFGLPLPKVIEPNKEHDFAKDAWGEKEGTLINSDFLNGLDVKAAIKKAIEEIENKNLGKKKINFRLRDAVFGRQRYWGEPIPIYYKNGIPYALNDNELPLVLPEVDKYLPTEDGEPPLARAKDWKYRPEPLSNSPQGGEDRTKPRWQTAANSGWQEMKERAKELRNNQTNAEVALWQQIKNNQLGYKFRRQQVIGFNIVDFVCLDKKLIIEVDGEIHNYQKEYDDARTLELEKEGYKVIRFENKRVFSDIDNVVAEIRQHLQVLPQGEDLGGAYDYEHSTMPGWAGSSWYFLRYMDPHNGSVFADKKLTEYWKQVDLYIGGSEHATGHLLYVRFWTKFLKDLGHIAIDEPAKKLINQGMIQGTSMEVSVIHSHNPSSIEDGAKTIIMPSNSKTSVIKIGKLNFPVDYVKFEGGKYFIDQEVLNLSKAKYPHLRNYELFNNNSFEFPGEFDQFQLDNNKLEAIPIVEKMSKSKWNVVSPDDIGEKFGADTLRLYEMFLGPLEQSKPWNTNGITGVAGFLKKLWRLGILVIESEKASTPGGGLEGASKAELKTLHKMIKKITEDIERFSFNTSVSNFMICVNELGDLKCNKRAILEPLLICLSPYAPHITEELWSLLGHKESIAFATFPLHNEEYLVDDSFIYPISFNGKMRLNIELAATLTVQEIEKEVMSREDVQKYLEGKTPKKIIIVPKKIVNIVI
ncbi:MAG: class I tRNA ligase family protein [Bacteroidota bacterium]|nr:class I tRNA ligase family protein [Bacteroidota bacterium]MDP3144118.1 class I tRNA ligase family protein [Bacteroidota bacterium]